MKAVVDTNLLISGIFLGGLPGQLLEAWRDGHFDLVLSPGIFAEYEQVCERLALRHPGLSYTRLLSLLLSEGEMIQDATHPRPITADADDDKFMIVARTAGAVVVSGDRHLLDADGWSDVRVLTARDFLDELGLVGCRSSLTKHDAAESRGSVRGCSLAVGSEIPHHMLQNVRYPRFTPSQRSTWPTE